MFERFTNYARRAVVVAQEEARSEGSDVIKPEHLLRGVAFSGGLAGHVLEGVILGGPAGPPPVFVEGHLPFTPESKNALELSLRAALQLGHNYIGTEHILMGLIKQGEAFSGMESEVVSRIRETVTALAQASPEEVPPVRSAPPDLVINSVELVDGSRLVANTSYGLFNLDPTMERQFVSRLRMLGVKDSFLQTLGELSVEDALPIIAAKLLEEVAS